MIRPTTKIDEKERPSSKYKNPSGCENCLHAKVWMDLGAKEESPRRYICKAGANNRDGKFISSNNCDKFALDQNRKMSSDWCL